jgi:hypothetical protein
MPVGVWIIDISAVIGTTLLNSCLIMVSLSGMSGVVCEGLALKNKHKNVIMDVLNGSIMLVEQWY